MPTQAGDTQSGTSMRRSPLTTAVKSSSMAMPRACCFLPEYQARRVPNKEFDQRCLKWIVTRISFASSRSRGVCNDM